MLNKGMAIIRTDRGKQGRRGRGQKFCARTNTVPTGKIKREPLVSTRLAGPQRQEWVLVRLHMVSERDMHGKPQLSKAEAPQARMAYYNALVRRVTLVNEGAGRADGNTCCAKEYAYIL